MEQSIFPKGYESALNLHDTQIAIKTVKDFFQKHLAQNLNLARVSAPLFVLPESGLNANLNGVERPVDFGIREQGDKKAEVVHSLAKWKRFALDKYGFSVGEGIYTDMNAIRRDEVTDNIHSIFVDQWDWEKIITKDMRTVDTFKATVSAVYKTLQQTEKYMSIEYDYIGELLPKEITFITSQKLLEKYPGLTPHEREYAISKECGAVCIMQIGDVLSDGMPHDGRAPDYDDWALNGDIFVYYPVLDIALEISSMGIRVDEESIVQAARSVQSFPSRKRSLKSACPTPSAAVSASPASVCFSCARHISARCKALSGEQTRSKRRRLRACDSCSAPGPSDEKSISSVKRGAGFNRAPLYVCKNPQQLRLQVLHDQP